MPACTGLPPGELMRITTATAVFSSNALRSAETMFSALASPSDVISPRISTSAVCGPFGVLVLPRCADTRPQTTATANRNQARRLNRRQRRSLRRSRISSPVTCASTCSRREKSALRFTLAGAADPGAGVGAGMGSGSGGVCVGSNSLVMGCRVEKKSNGAVEHDRADVRGRIPIHLAAAFDDVDGHQALARARAGDASAAGGLVDGTVHRAQDETAV